MDMHTLTHDTHTTRRVTRDTHTHVLSGRGANGQNPKKNYGFKVRFLTDNAQVLGRYYRATLVGWLALLKPYGYN